MTGSPVFSVLKKSKNKLSYVDKEKSRDPEMRYSILEAICLQLLKTISHFYVSGRKFKP